MNDDHTDRDWLDEGQGSARVRSSSRTGSRRPSARVSAWATGFSAGGTGRISCGTRFWHGARSFSARPTCPISTRYPNDFGHFFLSACRCAWVAFGRTTNARGVNQARASMNETTSTPTLLTVSGFCQRHEWARPGGLRHAIFFGESNGFNECVVRFGRKLLLDEVKVFRWLRERGGSLSGSTTRAA